MAALTSLFSKCPLLDPDGQSFAQIYVALGIREDGKVNENFLLLSYLCDKRLLTNRNSIHTLAQPGISNAIVKEYNGSHSQKISVISGLQLQTTALDFVDELHSEESSVLVY